MNHFLGTICVILKEPISPAEPATPNSEMLVGYYVNIGVKAAEMKDAIQIISDAVSDGRIDWKRSEWKRPDLSIIAKAKGFKGPGIWFKSGRALFGNQP